MSYGRRRTTTLSAEGQISDEGVAAELLFLIFTGATAGDKVNLKNGSGGDSITGDLLCPANGSVVIGPFDEGKGIVFSADIYCDVTLTGVGTVFAVYRELE